MRNPDFDLRETFDPTSGRRRPRPGRRDPRGRGHGHGPGFGPDFGPGSGPGFGPGFGERRRGGPRARRGAVRLAALSVLADGPTNGYGLITTFTERTEGRWRPSPGSIYPVLRRLTADGLVEPVDAEGTQFQITEDGAAYLADHAAEVAQAWDSGRPGSQTQEELHVSARKLVRAARQVGEDGSDDQRERAAQILDEARRQLYGLLAE
ncbi:PadR family transcriptional regulator [Mumia sp. zg.B17]|uniref:PadR family transcriptional regulator n=1 Tax=unclassified Mumia TaxID=2621872 RepID=UPI001C6EA58A|nr:MULTISPECIES: PadR family transcriptional regulator [unclassified Mumia]MBW9206981.1 PadR family transcriptional regulator [Mumia sp. zg.B17]MDD9349315.1 PadR family transcriptional regulator [Mumia sp.]